MTRSDSSVGCAGLTWLMVTGSGAEVETSVVLGVVVGRVEFLVGVLTDIDLVGHVGSEKRRARGTQ